MNALVERIARGIAGWRPPESATSLLQLEQILPLDARRRVCVVRCGEHRMLLLIGGANDVAVGWIPADGAEPPAA